jgi:hypothetical protein
MKGPFSDVDPSALACSFFNCCDLLLWAGHSMKGNVKRQIVTGHNVAFHEYSSTPMGISRSLEGQREEHFLPASY